MASQKTFTFAIMHMGVAFAVVYLMTGSLALGGAVAMVEPAVNTIAYFFHEKVWDRFGLGGSRQNQSTQATQPPADCPFAVNARPSNDPIARCLQCQSRARSTPQTSPM